jgi:hypothetical protein
MRARRVGTAIACGVALLGACGSQPADGTVDSGVDAAVDAAPCPAEPVGTFQGSGTDAYGATHSADVTGTVRIFTIGGATEVSIDDPNQLPMPLNIGVHCNGEACAVTAPGTYDVAWRLCWENPWCHSLSAGVGEWITFDRVDSACIAGRFHLVGGDSAVPGDFTGTFAMPL